MFQSASEENVALLEELVKMKQTMNEILRQFIDSSNETRTMDKGMHEDIA